MKKNVFITVILILLLTVNAVSATEHTENITEITDTEIALEDESVVLASTSIDEYNNLYYPQSIYNDGLNFLPQTTTQEAYVNPATGSTNVMVTDAVLPGINGFNLEQAGSLHFLT